ncbi:MAG: RsmB/NOP family class I SAM-dependent RNA methyltransferase [Bdellovibrio sp.]
MIHPILVRVGGAAVFEIFDQHRPADRVLESCFKSHRKLGSRDRRWIAERVYNVCRHWRRLQYLLGEPRPSELQSQALILLDWYFESGEYLFDEFVGLGFASKSEIESRLPGARARQEIWYSYPDWLFQFCREQRGDDRWGKDIQELDQQAPVDLRVNLSRKSREEVQQDLALEDCDTYLLEGQPAGLSLRKRKNIFSSKTFQSGFFEVQDRASQEVARLLAPEPGMTVIDSCAGAGGKTLHMADLMRNKGRIIALDVHSRRLEELRERSRRDGFSLIETRLIESSKVLKRLHKRADRLLLDVPCSGSGVWRRNPDAKWWLTPDKLAHLQGTKKEILRTHSALVKPGGRMLYSTCSIFPGENQQIVREFLNQIPEFKLETEVSLGPSQREGDGFFMALFQRNF